MSEHAEPTPNELLVSEAIAARVAVEKTKEELAKLETQILALGKGKYAGALPGQSVTVVAAVPSSPGTASYDELPEASVEKAREIASSFFRRLFTKHTVYIPVRGFAEAAPVALGTAKGRELLDMCRSIGKGFGGKKAYILW